MTPTWIAADWGGSNARFWAIDAYGAVLGMRMSDTGIADLAASEFEQVLISTTGEWLDTAHTVIACGTIGSRQGWVDAPYQTTPCAISPQQAVTATMARAGVTVHVLPGIRQTNPADVMHGEETQIAGFLARNEGWDGVICLPGAHTKWVHISAGEIVSFQTFMTGEMFALLADMSVLQHSIAPCGWDADAFETALSKTMSRPEGLASGLFSIRAEQLVHDPDTSTLHARLSGLLIGAELAAAKLYWLSQNVAVIGADTVSMPYVAGPKAQGVVVERADDADTLLVGLMAPYALLWAN